MQLFSSEQTNNQSIQYQSNPEIVYARNKDWLASFAPYHDLFLLNYRQSWIDSFYQRLTSSNVGDCDPAAVTILGLIDASSVVRGLRCAIVHSQFFYCHLILLLALFLLAFRKTITRSEQMEKLAVAVLIILLPAVTNLLFAASTISTSYPYLMESELSLHLALVLVICGTILLTRAQWNQPSYRDFDN